MRPGRYWKRRELSARELERLELQRRALELRRQGLNYHDIARELNIDTRTAYRIVQEALTRWIAEPAEDVRLLELQRLDALLAALWDKAIAGDLAAVDRVLRIMERRAKLLGLDQIEIVNTDLGYAVLKLIQKLPPLDSGQVIDGEYRTLPEPEGEDSGGSGESSGDPDEDA